MSSKKKETANTVNTSDFSFLPLDMRFVSPKPRHNIEDQKALQLEREGNLIITRKRDGYCHSACFNTNGDIKLYTRTNREVTELYPNIVKDLRHHDIPHTTLISLELIVDENGKDAFPKVGKLAKTEKDRLQVLENEGLYASVMPFNILAHNGKWIHNTPNEFRFELLQRMFEGNSGSSVKSFEIINVDFATAKERMRKLHWEGLVLYHRLTPSGFRMNGKFSDPYRPYGSWKKKDKHEDDFVAIEKIPSEAKSWKGALKEFVIVQYDKKTGEAIPCGKIGNGFSVQERWDLIDDEKFPLPLVVQVRFSDRFIDKGKGTLRFGDFVTVRYDKTPDECIFDRHNYKHTPAGANKTKQYGK